MQLSKVARWLFSHAVSGSVSERSVNLRIKVDYRTTRPLTVLKIGHFKLALSSKVLALGGYSDLSTRKLAAYIL